MLSVEERRAVASIKQKIRFMLQERARTVGDPSEFGTPSAYWNDFCRCFKYLLGMQEEDFDLLRLHTFHLDGENYQSYYFGHPELLRRNADYEGNYDYDSLIHGIPEKFLLSAPLCLGEYGLPVDGRVVNMTVMRMQRVVRTLWLHGILEPLVGNRPMLLEVGGGYGCLAYHLSHILENARYVIVDLPETLLFSAVYLTLAQPEKRLFLWNGSVDRSTFEDYDFVLIPNYALHQLRGLSFDIALNVASFQELRADQLRTYLDFIEASSACLYSWNRDVQDKNVEGSNVAGELMRRFSVQSVPPPPRLSPSPSSGQGAWGHFVVRPYREYLCYPTRLTQSVARNERVPTSPA